MKSFVTLDRPEKWTAGVDWFRWKVDHLSAVRGVRAKIRELQQRDADNASAVRPWRFNGYEGLQTDSIRWGKRGGYLLWESSGKPAASTLAFMEPSVGYCLRTDLHLTLSLEHGQPDFGMSLISSWTPKRRTSPSNGPLRGVSTRSCGLWLGTVGRRTSRNYLRIYDKGVEAKCAPKGKIWRVELEAKYSHARELACKNLSSLTNPKFCESYVVSSLTRSGLHWPFGALGNLPVDIRLGVNSETTPGRLASWLTHTVRPTIPRLLTVFTVAEVLEMLNLSDVAVPTGKDSALSRSPRHGIAGRPSMAGKL